MHSPRLTSTLAATCSMAWALLMPAPCPAADKGAFKTDPREVPLTLKTPPTLEALQPAPAAPAVNMSLTPVSATNVRIEWQPLPGAVRYVISRNGAADIPIDSDSGYQQGDKFVYTDVGRRPATLQSYGVMALFPAPTTPRRSALTQVLMPAALAPQGFRAAISGPGAIALNWAGRPEAARYQLIRNGGNLPATVLNVSGLNVVDQNLPPGDYTYVLYSIVRLASGEEVAGEMSSPVSVRLRPFNILAIGDSVMWGQGLLKENKFADKTREWIRSQIGGDVILKMRAHSGAVTYPETDGPNYENRSYDGEVPADWPTISRQLTLASIPAPGDPPANEVDLLLIDGCANNLGIVTVLNPLPIAGNDDESLRNDTRAYCGAGITNILRDAVRRFPNAEIVVTGYFPYASRESDLGSLLPVVQLISAVHPAAAPILPPDPVVGGLIVTTAYRERVATRSEIFYQESNNSLQGAVDLVNREALPGRRKFGQIRFARLNPLPKNAYGGSSSWQFLIPSPPFAQDQVYEERRAQCYKVNTEAGGNPDLLPGAHLLCIQASMGHPNAAGAQAYADAIKATAATWVPGWRAARPVTTVATEDAIVVRARAISNDASGGTLTITAADAVSGASLAGTVQLNGVAAGALGVPLRYTFLLNNPSGITGTVQVPNRAPRYFNIPARSVAVSVEMRQAGDPRTAVVNASDSVSGQLLGGIVVLQSITGSLTTGSTGQSISYPSCGPAVSNRHFNRPMEPVPCAGTVRVPFYPDTAYQDMPGAINTGRLQAIGQP